MSDQNFTKLRPPSYGTINSKGEIVIPSGRNSQQHLSTTSQDLPFEERTAQHEGYISLPGFSDEDDDEEERDYNTLLNEYLITTPFIFLALFSFIILLHAFSEVAVLYKWDIFLLGVTGWCAVFLIRKPIFFMFSKLISLKVSLSSVLTLLFVGFIEEIVRMGWLYRFEDEGEPFLIAYWLGLGWAAAEAVYFIIQNFIELKWYKDDLDVDGGRYVEEREELEEILGRPLTKVSAWWGVMWRTSWIMIHIGFSCWIAFSYALVFPAAFIHGFLLVIWGYCLPVFGIPATSYGTLLVTMSVFLIGLALFQQIV